MLREESQHKHLLRSRLLGIWESAIKLMIEPAQAVVAQYPSIFKSAMLVGDVVRLYEQSTNACCFSYLHAYMINLPETLFTTSAKCDVMPLHTLFRKPVCRRGSASSFKALCIMHSTIGKAVHFLSSSSSRFTNVYGLSKITSNRLLQSICTG